MTKRELKQIEAIKQVAGGSVSRKGDGWRWRLREGTGASAKLIATKQASTLDELEVKVNDWQARLVLGIEEERRIKSATTIGDLIDKYLAELDQEVADGAKSPNTRRGADTLVNQLEPLRDKRVTELTFQEVSDWNRKLTAKSGKSVSLLSRLLDDVGDPLSGLLPGFVNPLTLRGKLHKSLRGKPTAVGSRGGQYVTQDEWNLLFAYWLTCVPVPEPGKGKLKQSGKSPNLVRFMFLMGSGLRSAELRGLMLKDIIMHHGVLHVNVERQADNKGGIQERLKTDAAPRLVPLLKIAADAYHQRKAELAALGHTDEDTILFGDDDGVTTICDSALNDCLEKACAKLGLRHITPHNFRGTWATNLLDANPNIPEHVFKRYGGWKNITTAHNHYITLHPNSDKAAGKLDLGYGGGEPEVEDDPDVIVLFPAAL